MIALSSRLPAGLSLVLLALAITLPVLGPHHHLPVATFHQEWLAGALGLAAVALLALARDDEWRVPGTALLPLALVGLLWLQFFAGLDVRFETSLIASLYLVWAFLLMLAIARIAATFGRENTAEALAGALLAGALLLALTGFLQRWAPWLGMPWIFPSETIKGNIAQPNNFADYLWLGIVSACWLFGRRRLHGGLLAVALPVLMTLSLMSGSRSVYLYAVVASLWLLAWGWLRPAGERRRLLILAATLVPLLLTLQFVSGLFGSEIASAQRLASKESYDPVRLTLWRAALGIFADYPLLGAGFDTFSHLYFVRIERYPINGLGIPEHSHNLLTEFAAELGLAGLGIIGGGLALLLNGIRRRADAATMLAVGLLLILGLHSLLEYPLWYAHFLAIAVLMVALVDNSGWQLGMAERHRLVLLLLCTAGFAVLGGLRSDYVRLEEAANGRSAAGQPIPAEGQHATLLDIYAHSLLRPYAALQFAARMPLDGKENDGRLALFSEVQHFSPIRQAVFRYAALLYLGGKPEEALRQWRLASLAFPGDAAGAQAMIRSAAESEPGLQPFLSALDQRSF